MFVGARTETVLQSWPHVTSARTRLVRFAPLICWQNYTFQMMRLPSDEELEE
jgi:hypothetical protein